MLRHFPVVVLALVAAASAALAVAPACAANWVEIPGRIEFIADDGTVKHLPFRSWATNKETFVPAARGNDIRLAGYFAYTDDDQRVVIHVTEPDHFVLQGDGNPIIIVFSDKYKSRREVEVIDTFIRAIARTEDFTFIALDEQLKREVVYDVPSASIKRLWFHGTPPHDRGSRFPVD